MRLPTRPVSRLTAEARRDLADLKRHYRAAARPEAILRLAQATTAAGLMADNPNTRWFAAPRPYPELASAGFRWLKLHRYWFACTTAPDGEGIIHAILYDAANIPARLPRP